MHFGLRGPEPVHLLGLESMFSYRYWSTIAEVLGSWAQLDGRWSSYMDSSRASPLPFPFVNLHLPPVLQIRSVSHRACLPPPSDFGSPILLRLRRWTWGAVEGSPDGKRLVTANNIQWSWPTQVLVQSNPLTEELSPAIKFSNPRNWNLKLHFKELENVLNHPNESERNLNKKFELLKVYKKMPKI